MSAQWQAGLSYQVSPEFEILFSHVIAYPVSNPHNMMMCMLAEYNIKTKHKLKESEAAQTDGEYEQTMSGDGHGSGNSTSKKVKIKKTQNEISTEVYQCDLLSAMKGKRNYEAVIAMLDAHEWQENESGQRGDS
ncbi:hypothetical protein HOY80DRAFT_1001605 [Tuber brumale]|nr:hypothetical protein HOY80DRAFT_1001605 [Tuber brumale]